MRTEPEPPPGASEIASQPPVEHGLGRDFWLFFSGQSVSMLGNSVTTWALPLLVFQLTGSALNLGLTLAVTMAPYLFFGLIIGAWVDRLDRKRLLIVTDVARSAVLLAIPLLAWTGHLSVGWIYAVAFVSSAIGIAFDGAYYAAVPHLVRPDKLVLANGRIQASYSAASIAGPLLAGVLVGFVALETVILVDALTFVISSGTLLMIARSFNSPTDEAAEPTTIRKDIVEGLGYVWSNPVLRALCLALLLVNLISTTLPAQIIYFAQTRLNASEAQTSLMYAVGGVGIVVCSLAAGRLRDRFTFSQVALGALIGAGALVAVMSLTRTLWVALPLWGGAFGLVILFNICATSLRQQIVPSRLMGRVTTVILVITWSIIPIGTLIGGWVIDRTGNVAAVYFVLSVAMAVVGSLAFFTPLGHAEKYIDAANVTEHVEEGRPSHRKKRRPEAATVSD